MATMLERIAEANRTQRPEDDVTLRLAVLGAVEVGLLAAVVGGAVGVVVGVLSLLALPAGAWVSWRRRAEDNVLIKVLLTVGALWALWAFLGGVRTAQSFDDTRVPLATLFVVIQVLHGFDLPQRRSLGFSLASSLALVALGASGTHAGLFGVLLVPYVALAVVALVAIQRSAAREQADELVALAAQDHDMQQRLPRHPPGPGWADLGTRASTESVASGGTAVESPVRGLVGPLRTAATVLVAGALVLAIVPRSDAGSIGALPFDGIPGAQLIGQQLRNTGLAGSGQQGPPADGAAPLAFSPDAYFGFAEYLDLRTVGDLPDTPVMRVSSPVGRPWRGMVFSEYDGRGWRRADTTPPDPTRGLPVTFAPQQDAGVRAGRRTITQTYELLTETPNLIYAAAEAHEIWIAGRSATRWANGTITTSTAMEEGTVYSVRSTLGTATPPELRAENGPVPADVRTEHTQLPDTVTDRTRALAAELTADAATPYAAAEQVETWLGANVSYSLASGSPPGGVDQVDHFLFDARVGWCEPIASAMVVLLRAADVPARLVTGFQPGDQNPISRVWDVRMSDAHAWVEVWVPDHGWTAFDPTGAVPLADDEPSAILALQLAEDLVDAVRAWAGRVGPIIAGAFALALLAGIALAIWAWRRSRRPAPPATPFAELARATTGRVDRAATATPREWAAAVRLRLPTLDRDDLAIVLADEEARRYARPVPHSSRVDAAEAGPIPDAVAEPDSRSGDAWAAAHRLVAQLEAGRR